MFAFNTKKNRVVHFLFMYKLCYENRTKNMVFESSNGFSSYFSMHFSLSFLKSNTSVKMSLLWSIINSIELRDYFLDAVCCYTFYCDCTLHKRSKNVTGSKGV